MAYRALRPILFKLEAERAHELALSRLEGASRAPRILDALRKRYGVDDARLHVTVWGREFETPVGLAAGFDKNARAVPALAALGFGFVEVGTVTRHPQEGNPKPRLFRIPKSQAVINRLGFNNEGADAVAARLGKVGHPPIPLGVNIGKSRITPLREARDDYLASFRALYPYADYFVVNVSSPNTPGLRELQGREPLTRLLRALKDAGKTLARGLGTDPVPILVKISPDLEEKELADVVDVVLSEKMNGIVATNTTLGRSGIEGNVASEPGGLSGAPLRERALEVTRQVYDLMDGGVPIIGVGGIFTGDDAYARIRAGATLVQTYTGFVYGGPATARDMALRLSELLQRDGYETVADAVGADQP